MTGASPTSCAPSSFTRDFTEMAAGSVLVEFGRTRVLCTASVEERVPPWLRGTGKGWVTAEYSMLPGLVARARRPRGGEGQAVGRTQEIQRLIGRSLRAVTDLRADGRGADHRRLRRAAGRRRHPHRVDLRRLRSRCTTRARRLVADGQAGARIRSPSRARRSRSASSTALPMLDLEYSEDVRAEVDMNVVMTGDGPLRRGAGHRRGRRVHARRARRRCSASPSAASREIVDAAARDARRAAAAARR